MATVDQTPTRRTARPTHGTCQLKLSVNATSYHVRPIPADNFAALKAYRLKKGDGTTYDVAQTVHGVECDCPDFVFNRDGIDPAGCKHVKALVVCGLLDGPTLSLRLVNPSKGLSLAEKADREAEAYRALGTPEGTLFARTMTELAFKIRMTHATTPEQYEGRIEILDADLREQWEARGYEEGRKAGCRCGD